MSASPHIVSWALDNEVEGPHSLTPVTCDEALEAEREKVIKLQRRVFELEFALADLLFARMPRGMKLVKYASDFAPDNV